jgi:hypothetical protein
MSLEKIIWVVFLTCLFYIPGALLTTNYIKSKTWIFFWGWQACLWYNCVLTIITK